MISEPILPPPELYPGRHRDAGPLTPDSLRGRDLLVMYEAWRSVFDLPGLLRAAGVTAAATHTRWLPGYREPDLHRFWRESRGKPFSELTWEGMPLRSAVIGSAACWYMRAGLTDADLRAVPFIVNDTIRSYEAVRNALSIPDGPRRLVVVNGMYHRQRAAVEAARSLGVPVVAIEQCLFPGLIYAETQTGATGNRSSLAGVSAEAVARRASDAAALGRATELLASFARAEDDRYPQGPEGDPAALRASIGVPHGHRVLLVLGQVCCDSAVVHDATIIDDAVELVREATAAAEAVGGWTVVVKPHPREASFAEPMFGRPMNDVTRRRLLDEFGRHPLVRVLGPGSAHVRTLMGMADAGLTLTSQAGLEMAAVHAKRVISCGRAFWARKGFTADIEDRAGVRETIADALRRPVFGADEHRRALAFVDIMATDVLHRPEAASDPERAARLLRAFGVEAPAASRPLRGRTPAEPKAVFDHEHATDHGRAGSYPIPKAVADRLRPEFAGVHAGFALQTLLDELDFDTVLDVGCGEGVHAELMLAHGKRVTAIDYGLSPYFRRSRGRIEAIVADVNEHEFPEPFDCVWASHVLEHQPDVRRFLRRLGAACRDGGVLAVTVPPLKHQIVGGHLTLWNAGLVLYNLAAAGVDCRDAAVCKYGYNISVLVRKRTIDPMPVLAYDAGDLDRLAPYLPPFCTESFNGDVLLYNWPGISDAAASGLSSLRQTAPGARACPKVPALI